MSIDQDRIDRFTSNADDFIIIKPAPKDSFEVDLFEELLAKLERYNPKNTMTRKQRQCV